MSVQKPRILRTGETLEPISCEVTIATDALPTCKLTLADDPGVRMHELIEVFTAQGSQGIFRVTDRAKAYGGEITLEMRGAFDTLSDDIIAGRTDLKGTPAAVLGTILAAQSTARWQLGTVAMTGTVKIKNDYKDLFELADSVRKDRSGYRWTFDYSTTPWTVNLVAMPADTVAEFRLGRNVASATIDLSDADMCTKLYMTVSTDSSSTLYTYENAAAQAEWGVIVKTVDVDADEVTDPAATGAAILAERAQPVAYITMDGYDLHKLTGDAYDRITLGSNCRVVLDGFAGTFIERVTKIKWPDAIGQPEKITVSLANNLTPFKEQLNIMKKTGGGNSRAIEEQERELVRHRADIDTSNERILLWATAEEWDDIAEQYQTMGKSEFALTSDQIQSTVLQTGITAGVATFDPTHTYAAGDKCIHNGVLYRFTSAHTGAWTGTDVATVSSQQSQIAQNAHDITLKVSEGDVATQLSVECGNVTISGGDLLVDGYLEANGITTSAGGTLTADTLEARFGEIDTVSALTVSAGSVSGADSYTMDSYSGDLVDSVKLVQIVAVSGTDNYKLQYKTFKGDAWTDAGTFSRAAATTLSGAWASGKLTVTASPQGATFERTIVQDSGSASWSGTAVTVPIIAEWYVGATRYTEPTGQSVYINTASKLTTTTITPTSSQQTVTPQTGYIGFSSVIVEAGGGSIPPSSHIQVESGGHYAPSYSAGGTQITSWVSTIRTAVTNSGYFYFDAWLSDNSSDKKRYYIKF